MESAPTDNGEILVFLLLFLLPRFNQMPYCQYRVVKEHPRAAPAHDLADSFAHLGLVAVRFAGAAKGFRFHMRAMVDPGVGVIAQGFAVGAQGVAARAVVAMAVQLDHQAHDLFFLFTLLGGRRGRHQLILPFSTE